MSDEIHDEVRLALKYEADNFTVEPLSATVLRARLDPFRLGGRQVLGHSKALMTSRSKP